MKPVDVNTKAGRMFHMDGTHRWVATNYIGRTSIALAYDQNPRPISGGPGRMETQAFTIEAVTPETCAADAAGTEMQMLRALLVERFGLKFHLAGCKKMEIYELTVGKGGPKLKAAAEPDDPPKIVGVVYPDRIEVPARSVTMDDFVAMP